MTDKEAFEQKASELRAQIKALNRCLFNVLPSRIGISFRRLQMLVAIERSNGKITPGQLCDQLEMNNANVAAVLRSLESMGLTVRRNHPDDGRKIFIELTQEGLQAVRSFRHDYYEWFADLILSNLSVSEQETLFEAGRLMQRLSNSAAILEQQKQGSTPKRRHLSDSDLADVGPWIEDARLPD